MKRAAAKGSGEITRERSGRRLSQYCSLKREHRKRKSQNEMGLLLIERKENASQKDGMEILKERGQYV